MAGIDSFTKLMLHMDGADTSTTFTDSEIAPTKTVTANGSAQIDTAQSKFGGASGLFAAATSDYLSTVDSTDWNFGSGDFTIDFWMMTSQAGLSQVFGQWKDAGGTDRSFSALLNSTANKIDFTFRIEPSGFTLTSTTSVNNGAWHHIAVVRNGTNFNLYVDGTSEASTSQSGSLNDSTDPFYIGAYNNAGTPAFFYDGWIDEFRVSKGVARWTANFTPPTSAYSLDSTSISGLLLMGVGT